MLNALKIKFIFKFQVGWLLVLILKDDSITLSIVSQIIAIALLFNLYKEKELNKHPFAAVMLKILEKPIDKIESSADSESDQDFPGISKYSKIFLAALLVQKKYSVMKMTPGEVIFNIEAMKTNANVLNRQLDEINSEMTSSSKKKKKLKILRSPIDQFEIIKDNFLGFQLACRRLVPPMNSSLQDPIWMNFTHDTHDLFKIEYDPNLGFANYMKTRLLINKAFKNELTRQSDDYQNLVKYLNKEPKLIHRIGLTPKKLPNLIVKNPLIAVHILVILRKSSDFVDYLKVLVDMEISINSLEVVNELSNHFFLPVEFLRFYFCNFINACELITDVSVSKPLVRVLCFLMKSLVQKKALTDADNFFLLVQDFCTKFSNVKEAGLLFKLLESQLDKVKPKLPPIAEDAKSEQEE